MTLIVIAVCDHCELPPRGSELSPYTIGPDGPQLHICNSCATKPFKCVEPSKKAVAIKRVVELALEGKP